MSQNSTMMKLAIARIVIGIMAVCAYPPENTRELVTPEEELPDEIIGFKSPFQIKIADVKELYREGNFENMIVWSLK